MKTSDLGPLNHKIYLVPCLLQANLDEKATKTKGFVRALMTSVCSSAISGN